MSLWGSVAQIPCIGKWLCSVELLSCPEQWGEDMEAENNSRANGIQPLADTDTLDVIYVHIQLNTYIYT